jgi:homoserine O-acetyltransferase
MLDAISTSTPAATAAAGSSVREGVLTLPGTLALHFGGQLENVRVAWRLVGAQGPVVAALGGISAGRYVTGNDPKGWWADVVGPGGALDTNRFQVLGFDFLGGSGQTSGPSRGQSDFPAISAFDQVTVLAALLDHLGIAQLQAIVGASYGAMVALAFGERAPERIKRIIAISGADRTHPMSTAWRSVQRAIVRYALEKNDGPEGLRLARALAMATYRSSAEFAARFNASPRQVDGRFEFPVESYLLSRGDAYAASYVPEAFVCLSESIDLHQVDATKIRVPVTLVAVREDQIVPLADMQALHHRLGESAKLIELSSLYGHDAFLKEVAVLAKVFADDLG